MGPGPLLKNQLIIGLNNKYDTVEQRFPKGEGRTQTEPAGLLDRCATKVILANSCRNGSKE